MSWSALDALSDSLDATKRLLLPFDLRRWLTLAVVVFFVSGMSGPSGFNFNAGGTAEPGGGGTGGAGLGEIPVDAVPGAFDPGIALVLLVAGVLLTIGLALAFVGAVMEFVFVEAARTEEPRVRGVFGDYLRQGLQLFLLRLGVSLVVIGSVVAAIALVAVSFGAFLLVLLLASPVLLLLALFTWLFLLFTTDFVVPVMIADDVGILTGWRRFWWELRADWREYAVYALARVVVSIGAGIIAGMGAALVAIVLAIPLGIVGIGGYVAFDAVGLPLAGVAIAAIAAVIFVAAFLIASTTLIQVPVATYIRYYSLLVLGEVSPRFDLIPEIRADIDDDDDDDDDREGGDGGTGGSDGGDGDGDDGNGGGGNGGDGDRGRGGDIHASDAAESDGSVRAVDATSRDSGVSERTSDETVDDERA